MPKKPARAKDRRHRLPLAFRMYFEQGISSLSMDSTVEGACALFIAEGYPDEIEALRHEYYPETCAPAKGA